VGLNAICNLVFMNMLVIFLISELKYVNVTCFWPLGSAQ
jgi:hypothetical protein